MDEVTTEKKKNQVPQERVTLNKSTSEKLESWITQLDEKYSKVLKITKSDLVQYLIESHDQKLSLGEMKDLRKLHHDDLRILKTLMTKIEDEKKLGQTNITLAELIKNLNLIDDGSKPKTNRTKAQKADPEPDLPDEDKAT
jgi:hypothetical protein